MLRQQLLVVARPLDGEAAWEPGIICWVERKFEGVCSRSRLMWRAEVKPKGVHRRDDLAARVTMPHSPWIADK